MAQDRPQAKPKAKTKAKTATRDTPTIETPAPDMIDLTAELRAWIRDQRLPVDLEIERKKFLTYCRAHKKTNVDWLEAFKGWLIEAHRRRVTGHRPGVAAVDPVVAQLRAHRATKALPEPESPATPTPANAEAKPPEWTHIDGLFGDHAPCGQRHQPLGPCPPPPGQARQAPEPTPHPLGGDRGPTPEHSRHLLEYIVHAETPALTPTNGPTHTNGHGSRHGHSPPPVKDYAAEKRGSWRRPRRPGWRWTARRTLDDRRSIHVWRLVRRP